MMQKMNFKLPFTLKNYTVNFNLGFGAFSSVLQGINNKTKKQVAIKAISRSIFSDEGNLINLEKELRIFERINHESIAQYYETIFTDEYIFVVMELLPNGTLSNIIREGLNFISEYTLIRWAKEILEALQYLHERNIAHRDLKPDNIAFDNEMQAKLIDFGLSTEFHGQKRSTTPCGTPYFTAPEVILSESYDATKADIWSFGMTLYVLLNRRFPFEEMSPRKYFSQLKDLDSLLDHSYTGLLSRVLYKALCTDPNKRSSAADLLKDPVFAKAEDISFLRTSAKKAIIPKARLGNHLRTKSNSLNERTFKPQLAIPLKNIRIQRSSLL